MTGQVISLDGSRRGADDGASSTIRQRFQVGYEYDVVFTRGVFDPANATLVEALGQPSAAGRRQRLLVFVDGGLLEAMPDLPQRIAGYAAAHAARLELAGEVVVVPGGEDCKNDPLLVPRLIDALLAARIDRHAYSVCVGGGAVLDAVGYASAIFHRGVRHVRIPTTVLAQDDSGVGVKNAVNSNGLKNLLGTFAPPWAVINDSAFIDALPPRARRAGMAEAVKVALIRDRAFFEWIEQRADALAAFEPESLDRLIRRCAELHMHQIAHGGDPFESGSARPLDYGHWAAHRLERLTQHAVSHGEAVAIGLALDTRYSVLSGLLKAGEDERVYRVLATLGFRLWHAQLMAEQDGRLALLRGLEEFREHLGGELTITLLARIGQGIEVHRMDDTLVVDALGWLRERDTGG